MPYYSIGIDEAGYGPSLGPLVVTAVVFQIPLPDLNIWQYLTKIVSNTSKTNHKIQVCDSKIIYQPARGIKALETSVLTFASLLTNMTISSISIKQFIEKLQQKRIENISFLPWYETHANIPIPLKADSAHILELSKNLKKECQKNLIQLKQISPRMIEVDKFNAQLQKNNKADVLFNYTSELLTDLLRAYFKPDNTLKIFIGKQGGRTYYHEYIQKIFPDYVVRCIEEKSDCSEYKIYLNKKHHCIIKFLKDGEEKHFTIALASMFCKYLRELGMKMFNDFWQSHVPDLIPTAGYYQDSRRFLIEIMPVTKNLGLLPEKFIRLRF